MTRPPPGPSRPDMAPAMCDDMHDGMHDAMRPCGVPADSPPDSPSAGPEALPVSPGWSDVWPLESGADTAFGQPLPDRAAGPGHPRRPVREDTLRRYEARINRVIDHIAADPAREFTLDELAGAAPFSRFHFHRIFAGLTGETVQAFIRRLRMDRAANMLAFAPDVSVTDVAMYCGFSSSQNFARAFRERFDMTPSEFRRRRHYRTGADREGACCLLADPFRAYPSAGGAADIVSAGAGAANGNAGNVPAAGVGYQQAMRGAADRHPPQHSQPSCMRPLPGNLPAQDEIPWLPDCPPHVRLDPDSARSDAMNVDVKEMPAYRVAYLRHIGPYASETIGPVWGRLMALAGQHGLLRLGVPGFGISWDNPEVTPPGHCRYDACIEIGPDVDALELADAGISVQTLPGGLYAEYRSMIPCDGFFKAWNDMYSQWLPASGWQCDDRPGYELYHDMLGCPPEGPWDVGICVAVRPL